MSNPGLIERARQMLSAANQRSTEQNRTNQQNTKKSKARLSKIKKGDLHPIWMETEASVTSCQREFVRVNWSRLGGS
jgi:hypothetical protein